VMSEQELDRYWKTVVNTIRDGIMIVNTRGAIVSVNRAFENMTGYSQDELLGKACGILECGACLQSLKPADDHWCDLFRYGEVNTRKSTIRARNGRIIHVIQNASILRDSTGNVIGAVGTLTDISDLIEKDIQIEAFREELRSRDGFYGIIGSSQPMLQVFDLIKNAAASDAPVIIYGESGSGKELVAQAIHEIGERRNGPFIKINCASLTDSLLESELFGHVRGAYTGAVRDRLGRFEKASGGDLFMDEIGDLPIGTQVKLLRVLEEKMIERVGASTPIPVDVRIISATNWDLPRLVETGKFRKDFFFRINVIPIHLPPLRDRLDDIPLLAETFFRKIRLKSDKPVKGISRQAMDVLMRYDWPGNVRELKSAFEYAFVACHDSLILPAHLPLAVNQSRQPVVPESKRQSFNMREIEKQELIEALKKTANNQSRAAEVLGVSRVTVYNRMKRYGINTEKVLEIV
ncbi:MAG: sigma-54 interaction domain-containing protein, partial [Desulfatirhabdiaceae bacterium]